MSATAMAASASAMSAANSARISRMKDEQCNLLIESYVAKDASVPSMKAYSECVERMYPDPPEAEWYGFTGFQLIFILVCFCAIIGALYKLFLYKNTWYTKGELITEGLIFGTLGGLIVLLLGGITVAVWF